MKGFYSIEEIDPKADPKEEVPPFTQEHCYQWRWQKLSKKNGIKLVGYTFQLKNYVRIPPISLGVFRDGATSDC